MSAMVVGLLYSKYFTVGLQGVYPERSGACSLEAGETKGVPFLQAYSF